jgi:ABC-type multidrug transport system ATPase subunit
MTALLVADSVSKAFEGRKILSSASLRAVEGEVRVMFGRNGSGKTTLLRIAAGLLPADNGVVHFCGQPFLSPRLSDLAALGLFFLPDGDLLSDAFSVRRQLEMISRRFDSPNIESVVARTGIAGQLDKRPSELSGGELRRAEMAAVLLRRPRCLLADEPYRGVSPRDAEDLTRIFRELAAGGAAVFLTGHNVATLLDAADHVTWCTSGTTYELGAPREACTHYSFRKEYLGN